MEHTEPITQTGSVHVRLTLRSELYAPVPLAHVCARVRTRCPTNDEVEALLRGPPRIHAAPAVERPLPNAAASTVVAHTAVRVMIPPGRIGARVGAFSCMWAKGARAARVVNVNAHLTKPLQELLDEYKHDTTLNDEYRARNLAQCIEFLSRLRVSVRTSEQLDAVLDQATDSNTGIGKSTREKLVCLLREGRIPTLEQRGRIERVTAMKELMRVWGIGRAIASQLVLPPHNIRSITQLQEHVFGRASPGDGSPPPARVPSLLRSLVPDDAAFCLWHHAELQSRIPREEVEEIIAFVKAAAQKVYRDEVDVTCCGSYRRGKSSSGDVDLLLAPRRARAPAPPLAPLIRELERTDFLVRTLSRSQNPWTSHQRQGASSHDGKRRRTDVWRDTANSNTQVLSEETSRRQRAAAAAGLRKRARTGVHMDSTESPGLSRDDEYSEDGIYDMLTRTLEPAPTAIQVYETAKLAAAWMQQHAASYNALAAARRPRAEDQDDPTPRITPEQAASIHRSVDFTTLPWIDTSRLHHTMIIAAARLPPTPQNPVRTLRQIDIKSYPRNCLAFALMSFTGCDYFNRSFRSLVGKCGWSLSDTGLRPVTRTAAYAKAFEGLSLRCDTEEDIFTACGVPYRTPEARDFTVDEAAAPDAHADVDIADAVTDALLDMGEDTR